MSETNTPPEHLREQGLVAHENEQNNIPITVVPLEQQLHGAEPRPEWLNQVLDRADHTIHITGQHGSIREADFSVDREDVAHIHRLADTYLGGMPAEKRADYARLLEPDSSDPPRVEDILVLSANIVQRASGQHNQDIAWTNDRFMAPLRNGLDFEARPDTDCKLYNGAYRVVFETLAERYNPSILERYRLLTSDMSIAGDVPDLRTGDKLFIDEPRQPHRYLALVSYDQQDGLRSTPVDPYHMGKGELSNSLEGLQRLDFTETRAADAFLVSWLAVHGERNMLSGEVVRGAALALAQAFPSGLHRLNGALVAAYAADYMAERNIGIGDARDISDMRKSVDDISRRPDSLIMFADDAGEKDPSSLVPKQDFWWASAAEIDQHMEQRAPAIAAEKALLAAAEADHNTLVNYVGNAISETILQGSEVSPLEFVSLARLLDYASARNVQLPDELWQGARSYMIERSNDKAFMARALSASDSAALHAAWRGNSDQIFVPEYDEVAAYGLWADYKVEYLTLLAKAGVTGWANRLPVLGDFDSYAATHSLQYIQKPDLPRAELYAHFIDMLAVRLQQEGLDSVASQVRGRVPA